MLAASLLSSVAQPVFGALTDRWAVPRLLPVSTLLGGVGIALSGLSGSYTLTLVFVAISGIGVAAYHPESARIASQGSHRAMGWFSTSGNIGFAPAPLMVTAVVATGGLRWTPLLVLLALAGAALCLPLVRALQQKQADGDGPTETAGSDDVASFVKLSLAVVFRSIAFVGLSTFIAVRPPAPGRQHDRRHRGPDRALPRQCDRPGAGRKPGESLGPGDGLALVVPDHGRGHRGRGVGPGPGRLPVRGTDLGQPVRPLLAAGHARAGPPGPAPPAGPPSA